MHKVYPGQQVRILTIQVAVPADTDPSTIAVEFTEMLTGATAEAGSNILDWQYLNGGPEQGEIVLADEDPEEGEIFTAKAVEENYRAFSVSTFGQPLARLHQLDVLLSPGAAREIHRILAATLEKYGRHDEIPTRLLLSLHGAYAEANFQPPIKAGLLARAAG
jgi:hypothetical protein